MIKHLRNCTTGMLACCWLSGAAAACGYIGWALFLGVCAFGFWLFTDAPLVPAPMRNVTPVTSV